MMSDTLPPEFLKRLRWFEKLRWLATVGLAVAAVAGSRFGVPQLWPSLFLVALFVGAYNLCFRFVLRRSRGRPSDVQLRIVGITEIFLDLAALLVTVHFTGGLMSPVLPFFVFHMAIGTTMLSTRTMYQIAAVTCAAVAALHLAERSGLLGRHAIGPGAAACGRLCDLNLTALMVVVIGTVYLMGTVTESSKRKSIELLETTRELRLRTVRLERVLDDIQDLERRKSHFMRISAHQLRSPLSTIKTLLQVLSQGYVETDSERGRRLLAGSVERADHLLAITNDLLELAKIREGQERAPWTLGVDIKQILAETVEALEPLARDLGVRLSAELEGRPLLRWGVPPDLRFAFENVIENALRYSHPRGAVMVTLSGTEEEATISVVDQGIGVPDELKTDVFLEFVRGPRAKALAPGGTGLGLAIVKAATELHGGRVALISRRDVGTTVTLSLPLHNAPPPGVRPETGGVIEAGVTGAGPRVAVR